MKKMKVNPVTPSPLIQNKKQLTFNGCCDKVDITSGDTIVQFSKHRYQVTVVYCKNCGSVKATSSIKHMRGQENEH